MVPVMHLAMRLPSRALLPRFDMLAPALPPLLCQHSYIAALQESATLQAALQQLSEQSPQGEEEGEQPAGGAQQASPQTSPAAPSLASIPAAPQPSALQAPGASSEDDSAHSSQAASISGGATESQLLPSLGTEADWRPMDAFSAAHRQPQDAKTQQVCSGSRTEFDVLADVHSGEADKCPACSGTCGAALCALARLQVQQACVWA